MSNRTCNICHGSIEGSSIPHGGGWGVAHARAEDCVAYRNKVLGDALLANTLERRQRRHFSAALTWIEQNLPGNEGIELVAKALSETNGDPRWFEREGRFHVTAQWPNVKNKYLCTEKATTFDEALAEALAAFEGQWFFRIEDTVTGEVQADEGFEHDRRSGR